MLRLWSCRWRKVDITPCLWIIHLDIPFISLFFHLEASFAIKSYPIQRINSQQSALTVKKAPTKTINQIQNYFAVKIKKEGDGSVTARNKKTDRLKSLTRSGVSRFSQMISRGSEAGRNFKTLPQNSKESLNVLLK